MQPLAPDDPRRIGRHRLLSRIGAGGMGRVYLALSAALDRVYVSWLVPGDDPLEDGAYTTHAFDTETGEDLAADGRGAGGLQEVSVHPGGGVLAGVSAEGRVVLVDPDTLEPAETLF
ncbi:hypothetical protein [Nocardiopsis tropica]|uniref:Serine/threonine protein kinase n=1 Tax=Nocardiopsis tropica TaxID=109330 RepID=A0ABU7KXC4_9ACTN|nr:hypothetical protein [Nocardiopsis umidischolae]MEE2053953.1 hypothetical protein [Nocardiopsis umidischolae]